MTGYYLGILALALIAVFTYNTMKSRRDKFEAVKKSWGKPARRRNDEIDSVSVYWENEQEYEFEAESVDSLTWDDLDMDEVYHRINATLSSVGAEYLYARLHKTGVDPKELREFQKLIRLLDQNKAIREEVQKWLAKLGKCNYNGVTAFLFRPVDCRLKHEFVYPILGGIPILAIAAGLFDWRVGLPIFVASFAVNIVVYYKNKKEIEKQLTAMKYIASTIRCAGKLLHIDDPHFGIYQKRLAALHAPLRKIANRTGSILSKTNGDDAVFAFLLDYFKIAFMLDFLNYNRAVRRLLKNGAAFGDLWKEIGRLDAALAVASYRRSSELFTEPVFTDSNEVIATGLLHPLLDHGVANPVALSRNAIITGSNASGKSTYVKAIAVNAILAETIGTCLAEEFTMQPCRIVTSMAILDNIVDGDSYFIAEIKSLRRIIDIVDSGVRCLCFIDEILKGTNTIERIAASAAILRWMTTKNCICVVASHDIELTEILKNIYDNYHFKETVTDDGVTFDYKIHRGFSKTRNAIKLLEFLDYPAEITAEAQRQAENFTDERRWTAFD